MSAGSVKWRPAPCPCRKASSPCALFLGCLVLGLAFAPVRKGVRISGKDLDFVLGPPYVFSGLPRGPEARLLSDRHPETSPGRCRSSEFTPYFHFRLCQGVGPQFGALTCHSLLKSKWWGMRQTQEQSPPAHVAAGDAGSGRGREEWGGGGPAGLRDLSKGTL